MKKMLFLSRHAATEKQVAMARKAGYVLVAHSDVDAFTGTLPEADAVAVVHPALMARCLPLYKEVGVFENENRAPEGERPQFAAAALHVYRLVSQETEDVETDWSAVHD